MAADDTMGVGAVTDEGDLLSAGELGALGAFGMLGAQAAGDAGWSFATNLTSDAAVGAARELPADDGHGGLFAAYLARKLPQIEQYLAANSPTPADLTSHVAMDLLAYLYEPFAQFTSSGGKRVRPALCLLGAEAVGADPIIALSTAAAVESFQTAALVHDDIADQSELRRGVPCLHRTAGTGIAINVGDMAITNIYAGLLSDTELDNETCLRLLCELTYMEQRTLEGQALDLGWARDNRWDVTVEDYLFMATSKTAYYSAASPLACGAICGHGTEGQVEALFDFGTKAGLAFQLQDDLLNIAGDPAAVGKDLYSDITEGKRTLLVVHALSELGERDRDELRGLLMAHTADPVGLARAVELMEQAGSVAYVRTYAERLVDEAKAALGAVELADSARPVLDSMADFFVGRTH